MVLYETPSTHVFESEVAVLVGAGIGITPFASIVKSVLMRDEKAGPHKIHLVWMNRDQFSFQWFTHILAELESKES
jgi:ferredoxin-NADP reductase